MVMPDLIPIPGDANNLPNQGEVWSEADWQAFVNGVGDMRARLEVIEGSAITDEQEIGIIAIPAGAGQNGRIQNAVFAGDAKPSWLTYGANGQFTITGRFPGRGALVRSRGAR